MCIFPRSLACVAIAASALLCGCASTLPTDPTPIRLPEAFAESAPAGGVAVTPSADWWSVFADPALAALEARVAVSNNDLARSLAQVRKARAEVDLQRAGAAPQLSAGLGVDRAHTSANVAGRALAGRTVDDHVASLGASWEPDLFGRVSGEVAAARGDADAAAADAASLQLTLQADVATDYLSLRSIEEEQALLSRTLDDQRGLLALTRHRLGDGTASELDVAQAQAGLEALEARRVDLDAQRAALGHALATLTGQTAATFELPHAPTPAVPLPAAPGVPSDLLRRRPDIVAAARRVAVVNAHAGVARRAWFPRLMISLTAGFESTALAPFLSLPSRAWALGPDLAAPLFDGGRRKAQLTQAEADIDAAAASYRGAVIGAVNDVEDQLSTLSALRQEESHQAQAVRWSVRAAEVADIRYQAGADAYADLFLARQASLSTQRDDLLLRRRQLVATVKLVRALGGGWLAETTPDPG